MAVEALLVAAVSVCAVEESGADPDPLARIRAALEGSMATGPAEALVTVSRLLEGSNSTLGERCASWTRASWTVPLSSSPLGGAAGMGSLTGIHERP